VRKPLAVCHMKVCKRDEKDFKMDIGEVVYENFDWLK
jgi:hypothetical protein